MSDEHRPDADTTPPPCDSEPLYKISKSQIKFVSNTELLAALDETATAAEAKMQEYLKAKEGSQAETDLAAEWYAIKGGGFHISGELLYRQSIQDMYYQIGQRIDW